ncbi:MAG: transposase [Myxococcota bacterium]
MQLRHWVLVPPSRWAPALPAAPDALRRFRGAVARRVVGLVERRARAQLGHGRGKAGALAVLHTVASDLTPRAHVHLIATDGVFVPGVQGPASFVALDSGPEPPLLRDLARAVEAAARSALPDPPRVAASSTLTVRLKGSRPAPEHAGEIAQARGAEVFVGEPLERHDRASAERLAAYVTRPPLAPGSVTPHGQEQMQLRLREPAYDRTVAIRMPRATFDARLRAVSRAAPKRRVSLHGALAPGCGVRWRGDGVQLRLLETEGVPRRGERAVRCSTCGERLEVVAAEPG